MTMITPAYLIDKKRFIKNICDLNSAIKKYYSNYRFAYSFKTNYYHEFLNAVKDCGCYAEVVSPKEFEMARNIGFDYSDIIFNGVIPTPYKEIIANNGGIANIDNLKELYNMKVKDVGLRLTFDVGNGVDSRFGIHIESEDYIKLKKHIKNNQLSISCVQCHISHARDKTSWKNRVETMIRCCKELNAKSIDLGGNMYGRIDNDEFRKQFQDYCTFDEYGEIIGKMMKTEFPKEDILLITEGGTPIVSDCMKIAFTVISIKKIIDKTYIIVDGMSSDVGFVCQFKNPPFYVLHKNNEKLVKVKNAYVVGCSCLENDFILTNFSEDIAVGDVIVIENVGAYSNNLVNDFIVNGCRNFIFD